MEKDKKNCTPLMVDIPTVQAMTGLSRKKAIELVEDANAFVDLGFRRKLANVQALQYYINSRTGANNDT